MTFWWCSGWSLCYLLAAVDRAPGRKEHGNWSPIPDQKATVGQDCSEAWCEDLCWEDSERRRQKQISYHWPSFSRSVVWRVSEINVLCTMRNNEIVVSCTIQRKKCCQISKLFSAKHSKSILNGHSLFLETGLQKGGSLVRSICDTMWWNFSKGEVCAYPI